ncbi:putative membrane protein [Cardamine amara subsp. amara]|uniref:Membrane protein n=1 Tax=Cardamine amara subsp. amara TaxID=228776 RepID=A0ABD0ZYN8_CARAN
MEPPKGLRSSLFQFLLFLPYFTGLLFLGVIKGIVLCPLVCLIVTIGNSAVILSLLPVHIVWTFYSILSAKQVGPILKLFLCLCLPVAIILWPILGILGSVFGGAIYGFFSPIFATFDAVGEGKSYQFFHCFYDGTWSSIQRSFTVVRDFKDVCFHSYFSLMDELKQACPDGNYYEIRLLQLPGALVASAIGILVDFLMISLVAICKSPYMLFKGWHRLFQDLIGREGPFLETLCVPIAGLVILLWPLAVSGAVIGSVVASVFLGAYAGVVSYQESSFYYGLCFVVASVSIYDEYSNDILDMAEGSCFPRPKYRRNEEEPTAFSGPIPRLGSVKNTSSIRAGSVRIPMIDIKPLELLEALFVECRRFGEDLATKGLINSKDIEEARSIRGSQVISIGLPAYALLYEILRSVKANSSGLLLSDGVTELTTMNRPKDAFFDWFLHPFLILKEQLKSSNLSDEEEEYLGRLVLLFGDSERLKSSNASSFSPPLTELKRAELDAFARRIQGLTKTVSRYPTFRRHFVGLVKKLSEDLDLSKDDSITEAPAPVKIFSRIFSQRSFRRKGSVNGSDQESQKEIV